MDDADELRARLRGTQRGTHTGLDDDAYGRIVQHVVQHGPTQVRRSLRRRSVMRASALALPLVLVAGWFALRGHDERERTLPATNAPSLASAPKPACASRAAPAPITRELADGRRRIDLAEVGLIVLEAGSDARLETPEPCRLQLQLVRGRASVHAANLFGGELRVRTGTVEVVVHGTKFAVEAGTDETLVDVESGAVSVELDGQALDRLVRSGQRLRVDRDAAPAWSSLPEADRRQLLARLDATAQQAANEPPSSVPPASVAQRALPRPQPARASAAVEHGASALAARSAPAALPGAREDTPQREDTQQREAATAPRPRPRVSVERVEPASSPPAPPAQPRSSSAEAARPVDAAALVARADAYWRDGDLAAARDSYRSAGALSGPTAEAAWLSLARNELADGRTRAAREALANHARRFPRGKLAGEAAGIEFRAALQAEDSVAAERIARHLVLHYADTPQAKAAARWLHEHAAATP